MRAFYKKEGSDQGGTIWAIEIDYGMSIYDLLMVWQNAQAGRLEDGR
jgi:hypothetical protein